MKERKTDKKVSTKLDITLDIKVLDIFVVDITNFGQKRIGLNKLDIFVVHPTNLHACYTNKRFAVEL